MSPISKGKFLMESSQDFLLIPNPLISLSDIFRYLILLSAQEVIINEFSLIGNRTVFIWNRIPSC